MFIAGRSGVAEPPVNDIWTVPGEEKMLADWVREDTEIFNRHDPTVYYMQLQIEDFLKAIENDTDPMVYSEQAGKPLSFLRQYTGQRVTIAPVKFPIKHEDCSVNRIGFGNRNR
jgi:hypothetical protein